jgi:hypothetical protein
MFVEISKWGWYLRKQLHQLLHYRPYKVFACLGGFVPEIEIVVQDNDMASTSFVLEMIDECGAIFQYVSSGKYLSMNPKAYHSTLLPFPAAMKMISVTRCESVYVRTHSINPQSTCWSFQPRNIFLRLHEPFTRSFVMLFQQSVVCY